MGWQEDGFLCRPLSHRTDRNNQPAYSMKRFNESTDSTTLPFSLFGLKAQNEPRALQVLAAKDVLYTNNSHWGQVTYLFTSISISTIRYE
jgi:hypothetical protein